MDSINWDDIRYCLAVITEGSVTAAAKKLDVNHATVSRRISGLESVLGAPLFDRSTSGWLVTPVGEAVIHSAEQINEQILGIQRTVQVDRQELSGKLRVTALDVCIQRILMPGLKAFSARYPDINLELIASESTFNLAGHEADIAFRTTNEPPPNVLGTKIAKFAYAIYGSKNLYQRYLTGDHEVSGITWMGDGHTVPPWMQKTFPGMQVRYRVNSLSIAYDLVAQEFGFALLPCGLGDSDASLTRIDSDYIEPGMDFWLLSHIDLRTTARIRIFRDFMLDAIQPYIPLIEGRMTSEEVFSLREKVGLV
ncbi:LysR family transcriptional regulator [Zhongshania aquimaris]|uniref:LysR family transcriptional regulator n=1 Tax=Zhongshania aquimaris TaxID=2857107 RepID=A0ABS6VTR3_9GAMM|nr:LysR family transcriptional regulator [Zhongshania aquimaris]MBW2941702.1 LysR family transcriptional regulator [Zhongshania aquimaris]